MKPAWFALLGAVSGALAATAELFFHFGDVEVPRVFGVCFGFSGTGNRCDGVDAVIYWFPGAIFGVLFGLALLWLGRFDVTRAAGFAVASWVGNAIAVVVCVGFFNLFSDLISIGPADLPLALAGAPAGFAGGALLTGATRLMLPGFRVRGPILAAAGLGLLVPLVIELEFAGTFMFYMLWQGGYGTALMAALARPG